MVITSTTAATTQQRSSSWFLRYAGGWRYCCRCEFWYQPSGNQNNVVTRCKEIADLFEGIIIGKSNARTHRIYHLTRDEIVNWFLPFVEHKNPLE